MADAQSPTPSANCAAARAERNWRCYQQMRARTPAFVRTAYDAAVDYAAALDALATMRIEYFYADGERARELFAYEPFELCLRKQGDGSYVSVIDDRLLLLWAPRRLCEFHAVYNRTAQELVPLGADAVAELTAAELLAGRNLFDAFVEERLRELRATCALTFGAEESAYYAQPAEAPAPIAGGARERSIRVGDLAGRWPVRTVERYSRGTQTDAPADLIDLLA